MLASCLPLYRPFAAGSCFGGSLADLGDDAVPGSVAGLIVDLDAARGVSLNGADVAAWADQSGNGNHVAQGTANLQPAFNASNPHFRSRPSIDFHKSAGEYLFGSSLPVCTLLGGSDKPFTAFVVCRRWTKATADEYCLSLGNSAQASQSYLSLGYRYQSSNSQRPTFDVRDDAGTAATVATGQNEIADLGPQVLAWSASGTVAQCYVLGASQNPLYDAVVGTLSSGNDYTAHGAITFNRFAIGAQLRSTAGRQCDLEVARVLVYGRELTEAERVRVALHLWRRYVRTAAEPAELTGLIHHWDASRLTDKNDGDAAFELSDSVGERHFQATDAGTARPTVRITPHGLRCLEFNGSTSAMTAGAAANWTFLHNGADFSAFVAYRVRDENRDALEPLLDTLDNAPATKNGLGIYHNNAGGGVHALAFKVGASNATAVLNQATQNGGARPQEWRVAHITHEGSLPSTEEHYQLWLDNENFAAVDQGVAPAAGAASHPLTLGKLAGSATFAKVQIGEILIYDRKLGRPGESQLVHEYLARKWRTDHVAVVGGNGLAGVLNDAAPHRAFPAICQDGGGTWHCVYRRAPTHGSSRGVGIHATSVDGLRWSGERVIYDIDDTSGRDFRGEAGFVCLKHGAHAGRLLFSSLWSDDASGLLPGTIFAMYSDDRGVNWTEVPITAGLSPAPAWDFDASPNALIETSSGKIILMFTTSEAGEGSSDQDLRMTTSLDGGATWTAPTVVIHHDSIAWRVTEQHIVEYGDGYLLMTLRDDTNKRIYTMDSTDGGATWGNLANRFAGWGRPTTILDENERLYCCFRSATSNKAVWNQSDDRGATWTAEQPLFNAQSTTTISAYPTMTYASAARDAEGNVWLCCGLEQSPSGDSDVFVRPWRRRRPTKALRLVRTSNQYLSRADSAAWAIADGFTAAGWVYRDTTGTAYLAGKFAGVGAREWALYCGASDVLTARLSADGTNATTLASTLALGNVGQWYFVALRYDAGRGGAELALNRDDAAAQATAHGGGVFHGAADVRLGAADISLADSHDGRLDQWGFWRRALSDGEIAELRHGGRGREFRDLSDGLRKDLIAYYDLGQASGPRIDASGNGQHLAAVNGPTNADGAA